RRWKSGHQGATHRPSGSGKPRRQAGFVGESRKKRGIVQKEQRPPVALVCRSTIFKACGKRENACRNSLARVLELNSMGQPQFVHLHVHTDYSLLDGACETTELLDEASRQKMPAVAITDHGNLFAAANFVYEAGKRDVKPIIGCEVYVAKGSRHDRGEKGDGNNGQERGEAESGTRGSNHLVLLCESLEGYHNLIKLVSAGFLEGFYYKPRIDYDLLSKHSRGLIALSACLRGPVTEAVVEQKYDLARENAYRLRDLFGKGNFFLEIQDQGLEIEKGVNPELVRLSK